VAVMSWQGLSALASVRERLEPQNEAVRATLAGLGQIERDLAQSPTNAGLFALPEQALRILTVDGKRALQIRRTAVSTDGSAASAMQTVFYIVRDGALVRQSTPPQRLYAASASETLENVRLVPGVVEMQVRVWHNGAGWISPLTDADMVNAPGIEVRLLRGDGTSVRRVYAVG